MLKPSAALLTVLFNATVYAPYHWSRGGVPYGVQEPNRSALQQGRGGCRDRSELKEQNRTDFAVCVVSV